MPKKKSNTKKLRDQAKKARKSPQGQSERVRKRGSSDQHVIPDGNFSLEALTVLGENAANPPPGRTGHVRNEMTQAQQEGRGEVVLYETPDGKAALDVRLQGETVWLSQKQMGELFDKNVRTVSEHVRNVFRDRELDKSSVIRNFRITAADGKSYDTQFYAPRGTTRQSPAARVTDSPPSVRRKRPASTASHFSTS